MFWRIRGGKIPLEQTLLMGIVNVTPDSFSDGGQFLRTEDAVRHAMTLVEEGADLLDLGAESTRPGAEAVPAETEIKRLAGVIKALRPKTKIPLSIDTTKPEVAKACLDEGADIINDVSALECGGEAMARVIRESGAGVVLMHRRGNPKTMQSLTQYGDVTEDVIRELGAAIEKAKAWGISEEQIVIDPGLGFSKTAEQSLALLQNLQEFHRLGFPVLLGPSRKSFIEKITARPVTDREYGTAAVVAAAVFKGVQILRVHQIRPMKDVVLMASALKGEKDVRA